MLILCLNMTYAASVWPCGQLFSLSLSYTGVEGHRGGARGPCTGLVPCSQQTMYTIANMLNKTAAVACLYLHEGGHQLEVPRPETPCLVQRKVFEIGDQDDPVHLGLFALDQVLQR